MTICLAALCKDDDGAGRAIVAADRMVTMGGLIEFEHAVPKVTQASPYALALIAGDALVGNRIAEDGAREIGETNPPVDDIARQLAGLYEAARQSQLEEQLLVPRGLSLKSFYQAHNTLNPQITMMLDQQMAQLNLGVEILVAGVDGSGGHVHTIHNPGGTERQHDNIGYAAIGSGTIHALQSMIGFGHSAEADYHQTVFRVYASKRRAEVAPGVGNDTDMAVISPTGIHWLTDEELGQLRSIFEQFESATESALTEKLETFNLGEGGENGTAAATDGD